MVVNLTLPIKVNLKTNLTLLIKKQKQHNIRRNQKKKIWRKDIKGYGFLSFARKYEKQLLNRGLDSLKTDLKNVLHKIREFFRK